MDKHIYGAIIRESEQGGYWAESPDLPGCFGQGETFIEAVESMANGISTHLAALIETGRPIPKANRLAGVKDGEIIYIYASPEDVRLGVPTISAAEAARMLGVTPARVSHMIRDGRLIAERTASGTNVTLESVEAVLSSPRRPGRPRKAATA